MKYVFLLKKLKKRRTFLIIKDALMHNWLVIWNEIDVYVVFPLACVVSKDTKYVFFERNIKKRRNLAGTQIYNVIVADVDFLFSPIMRIYCTHGPARSFARRVPAVGKCSSYS